MLAGRASATLSVRDSARSGHCVVTPSHLVGASLLELWTGSRQSLPRILAHGRQVVERPPRITRPRLDRDVFTGWLGQVVAQPSDARPGFNQIGVALSKSERRSASLALESDRSRNRRPPLLPRRRDVGPRSRSRRTALTRPGSLAGARVGPRKHGGRPAVLSYAEVEPDLLVCGQLHVFQRENEEPVDDRPARRNVQGHPRRWRLCLSEQHVRLLHTPLGTARESFDLQQVAVGDQQHLDLVRGIDHLHL